MPRRAIALILTVLLTLYGCTVHKVQQVPTASVPQPLPDKERIVGITTLKGEDVRFDDPGASIVNGTLHGWVKKATYELPMDQVQRLWVDQEKISTARTMTFPKPADAKQVKLIANAATGLWGSYMIKQMVALRGRDVGKFYTAVNHSQSARKALSDWEVREELYRLKV